MSDIPDLPQQGPDFDTWMQPDVLCGPVAVSNSLAALEGLDENAQIALVARLARIMFTSYRGGTAPRGITAGVWRYLQERDVDNFTLRYRGWRRVNERFQDMGHLSLEWLHQGLGERSAVWLNLGFYSEIVPGYLKRESGHWVTLRGYAGGRLIINDPGPWVAVESPLPVTARRPLLTRDAFDQHTFRPELLELSGYPVPHGERALIDGAVVLRLASSGEPDSKGSAPTRD
ncbi:MAG: hypothetical protein AAGI11_19005 [Pseudomonadota bacterium]